MKLASPSEEMFQIPGFHISVIIPTYESAEALEKCIQSLKEQSYPIDEIIVVDGFSRDDTREKASRLGAKVILALGTQAAARNVGLTNSKGDYVFFLDSDQQLEADVVEDCVSKCLKEGAEAVKVPEIFVGLNFWGKCSALWKNRMVMAWGPQGGIPRFYRRSMLMQSAAFNDGLRWWEDLELHERLKLTGLMEAWCKGRVIHYENDSLQNMILKYFTYGQSIVAFRGNPIRAPYASMLRLTLSTLAQTLRDPGRSIDVFLGCLFLVAVKGLSVALGFLSRLR